MKSVVILNLSVLLVLVSCAKETTVTPKTEEEKTLYAMGSMLFGGRLKSLNLSEDEIKYLLQGAKDSTVNKEQIETASYMPKVREFVKSKGESAIAETKKQGSDFMKKFMTDEKEKAKTTQSGLIYVVLQEGAGAKPKPTDTVKVKYKGQLVDGTVFDENTEGVDLPLNGVIKGWAEGLQMMSPGGKMKMVIPPEIGYGTRGAGQRVPGGATLVFEVELMEIKKGAEPPPPPKK